ncbi:MAG: acyl-CoA synthetase [Actinomycetales bacterium]|nr:MAG: acyl-CoA synthetase [Actinomycetales bacterium]
MNGLPQDLARSHGVADLLTRTSARYPHKVALIDGDRTSTFAELDRAVTSTARSLLDRGLVPGDRVALLARNSWEFAVLSFATARAGLVLVPVNFMLKVDEVAFILGHAEVSAVIADAGGLHDVMSAAVVKAGIVPTVRGVISAHADDVPAGWDQVSQWAIRSDAVVDVAVGDDDPIRIMYTSGTESRPKGALLSSKALIAEYVSAIVDGGMTADDIDLHTLPLYHCAQLDCFLGPDVYLGATSIILPSPDPTAVLEAIQRYRVTKYFAPPTVWISLLRHPDLDSYDLSSLRKGYYGASPMPVEVLREIQERLPDVRLWNFYGQTEMAPVATILPPEDQVSHPGSAGRPVLNVETRVVDDANQPVPPGVVGEVVHRSPQATLGYFKDPERTAAAFDGGWFHSGDLGVFDHEGRLSIVDRKKDMIKTGGENVASREVEEALYLHPGVAEVAVFALPDPKWVEGVTAVVVAKVGVTLTSQDVRDHASRHLAGYKVPKTVFIAEALPKNPSGKILKRQLRETYLDTTTGAPS